MSLRNKVLQIAIIITLLVAVAIWTFSNQKKTEKVQSPNSFSNQRLVSQMVGQTNKALFPEIDKPVYTTAQEAQAFLKDEDTVYVVRAKDKTFIYPEYILGFHHIVNDMIDDQPVAVSLCMLSDSVVMNSRKVGSDTLT